MSIIILIYTDTKKSNRYWQIIFLVSTVFQINVNPPAICLFIVNSPASHRFLDRHFEALWTMQCTAFFFFAARLSWNLVRISNPERMSPAIMLSWTAFFQIYSQAYIHKQICGCLNQRARGNLWQLCLLFGIPPLHDDRKPTYHSQSDSFCN